MRWGSKKKTEKTSETKGREVKVESRASLGNSIARWRFIYAIFPVVTRRAVSSWLFDEWWEGRTGLRFSSPGDTKWAVWLVLFHITLLPGGEAVTFSYNVCPKSCWEEWSCTFGFTTPRWKLGKCWYFHKRPINFNDRLWSTPPRTPVLGRSFHQNLQNHWHFPSISSSKNKAKRVNIYFCTQAVHLVL